MRRASSSKPRVLFVSPKADWGGPANSLLHLVKFLRHRFEVGVLLSGTGILTEELAREDINVFSFPSLNKWSIPRVFRLITRGGFDLVYGNTSDRSSRNALIAAKLARVPFLYHIRSMAEQSLLTVPLNLADGVIATSHACSERMRSKVSPNKLHVVYNGTSFGRASALPAAQRDALLQQLGISQRYPLLVNVGRIHPIKGQVFAVQVVAELQRRGLDTCLLIVGDDQDMAYAKHVRTVAQNLGVDSHVFFAGFRRDVEPLLLLGETYVHTSVEESFGRAIIEAMAVGLPVVAFGVGGVPEIVNHGQTGYLVPCGDIPATADAVQRLASDPTLRERMGKAARNRVRDHFSDEATADQVADIIDRQILHKKKGHVRSSPLI